jgi:hypothetical protein
MLLVFATFGTCHALGVHKFWCCCALGASCALGAIVLVVFVVLLVLLCLSCSWCCACGAHYALGVVMFSVIAMLLLLHVFGVCQDGFYSKHQRKWGGVGGNLVSDYICPQGNSQFVIPIIF